MSQTLKAYIRLLPTLACFLSYPLLPLPQGCPTYGQRFGQLSAGMANRSTDRLINHQNIMCGVTSRESREAPLTNQSSERAAKCHAALLEFRTHRNNKSAFPVDGGMYTHLLRLIHLRV